MANKTPKLPPGVAVTIRPGRSSCGTRGYRFRITDDGEEISSGWCLHRRDAEHCVERALKRRHWALRPGAWTLQAAWL